ncbi:MAG: hypothetical protein GC180_03610 [Bacteroidetes bacterium]|nr:hypothetical protein [Bacteroidota bacterium]
MIQNRPHSWIRLILSVPLWGFFFLSSAQLRVIHFEGYINDIDHRAVVFNPKGNCDSLHLKLANGRSPDPDALVCYEQVYDENDLMLYEKNGVAIYVDSAGQLYSKDNYGLLAKPYYLNISLKELTKGKDNIIVEADDYDYDSLVLRAIPTMDYRLGKKNTKSISRVAIYYDNFTYPAKGELSPTLLNELYDGIKMIPEDGKVEDKLTIIIPVDRVNVPGTFSLYIYDLKGNILRMETGLKSRENFIYRENLMSGTYRYAIFFGPQRTEIKKGMFHFIEPPKPE